MTFHLLNYSAASGMTRVKEFFGTAEEQHHEEQQQQQQQDRSLADKKGFLPVPGGWKEKRCLLKNRHQLNLAPVQHEFGTSRI